MMGEITDETNQAKAFPLFGLVWSIGCVVGPLIGALADPISWGEDFWGQWDWFRRYPYVFALGALMLDWAEPLPERVREALQAPKMSERQFLWLEGKIVEHYVAMLFAYFQRKAVGPARRSIEI